MLGRIWPSTVLEACRHEQQWEGDIGMAGNTVSGHTHSCRSRPGVRCEGKGWIRRAAVAMDSYSLKHLGSSAESWCVRTGLAAGRSPSLGFTGGFGGWIPGFLTAQLAQPPHLHPPSASTSPGAQPPPHRPCIRAPADTDHCDGHGLTENSPTMDTSIQRALNDKLYEKRKVGALEYVLVRASCFPCRVPSSVSRPLALLTVPASSESSESS